MHAAIVRSNSEEDVARCSLGVLDEHVKLAVAIEDTSVKQLEFGRSDAMTLVFLDQLPVGKCGLRIPRRGIGVG